MWNKLTIVTSVALALCLTGCAGMQYGSGAPIMKAAPGDPAGSANIGTGSVTVNSITPPEAAAAGIGLGP